MAGFQNGAEAEEAKFDWGGLFTKPSYKKHASHYYKDNLETAMVRDVPISPTKLKILGGPNRTI